MKSFLVILVSFLAVCVMSEATVYTVGDATGWGIPTNPEFYDNWENNKIFRVGDQLVFNWNGMHDVAPVSEAQYDSCTKVTANLLTTSPATVNLTTVGDFHFICTIGSHCTAGQKLSIEVVAATGSPPSTTASPPSTTVSPPSTTESPPSTTTTSPPKSSSSSLGPVAAISAALTGLAFLV